MSWLTVKVRVGVAVLRTDQTVGSSVTNVRVVTVSGVTWTSFDRSSHGKCKCQLRSRPKWPGQSESGQPQGEKNPVTTCRVSKTLCHDRPAAVTGKQILRRAQSQGAKLENNLQNCSGASPSVFVSVPYLQCIASSQPRGSAKESRTNSTHPPSGPAGYYRLRKRNSRSMCAMLSFVVCQQQQLRSVFHFSG